MTLIGGVLASLLCQSAQATAFMSVNCDPNAVTMEKVLKAPIEFDDLVVSFAGRAPGNAQIRISVSVKKADGWSKDFQIANWSENADLRTSVNGQKDADGDMLTDTLLLNSVAREFKVKVDCGGQSETASLDHLDFSFVNSKATRPTGTEHRDVWGRRLDVRKFNQGNYANGGVICSPTSTTMLLNYWADQLGEVKLKTDVPWTQSGVYDPGWNGTGNWIFNTAYAGSMGLRAYVSRLNNVGELESWIAAGIPVATSVSYDLLRGKPTRGENDGHIVVLIGFTPEGDPIFNDPGRSEPPQISYKRQHFEAAWATSGKAVYLVYPPGHKVPKATNAPWAN